MSYVFTWCHTYSVCVIIHTMGVLLSIIWVWIQRCSGCVVRYIQFDMSYNRLMKWIECWDVINRGWDVIYSAYTSINIVGPMSLIQCVLYHRYNVCDLTDTHTEVLISYILVYCLSTMCLLLNIITCIHKHSVCDVTATGDDMS